MRAVDTAPPLGGSSIASPFPDAVVRVARWRSGEGGLVRGLCSLWAANGLVLVRRVTFFALNLGDFCLNHCDYDVPHVSAFATT